MDNFAKAAACPADPGRAVGASQSFFALFRDRTGPGAGLCRQQAACMATEACWRRLFEGESPRIVGYATEVRLPCLITCENCPCLHTYFSTCALDGEGSGCRQTWETNGVNTGFCTFYVPRRMHYKRRHRTPPLWMPLWFLRSLRWALASHTASGATTRTCRQPGWPTTSSICCQTRSTACTGSSPTCSRRWTGVPCAAHVTAPPPPPLHPC